MLFFTQNVAEKSDVIFPERNDFSELRVFKLYSTPEAPESEPWWQTPSPPTRPLISLKNLPRAQNIIISFPTRWSCSVMLLCNCITVALLHFFPFMVKALDKHSAYLLTRGDSHTPILLKGISITCVYLSFGWTAIRRCSGSRRALKLDLCVCVCMYVYENICMYICVYIYVFIYIIASCFI